MYNYIMYLSLEIGIIFLCFSGLKTEDISNEIKNRYPGGNIYPSTTACYNKFVGFKGSIQSPEFPRAYAFVCEWDIDVTRGFVVEFEFEEFRLPVGKDHKCDSYIVITYESYQEGYVKRIFCPTDAVGQVYTGSQTAHLLFNSAVYHDMNGSNHYGFKINYTAVAARNSVGSHGVKIILISIVTFLIVALCVCCFRNRSKFSNQIPSQMIVHQEPNAISQAEIQRQVMQAPSNDKKYLPFSIFQSRTSSLVSNRAASEPLPNRSASSLVPENRKMSIASTPRSKFTGRNSRIENLRTKLVARFSSITSHSSADISLYFQAPDRLSYTQLGCEERKSTKEYFEEDLTSSRPQSTPIEIPSIVIEFVK